MESSTTDSEIITLIPRLEFVIIGFSKKKIVNTGLKSRNAMGCHSMVSYEGRC